MDKLRIRIPVHPIGKQPPGPWLKPDNRNILFTYIRSDNSLH